jgi:hypothetical protein
MTVSEANHAKQRDSMAFMVGFAASPLQTTMCGATIYKER